MNKSELIDELAEKAEVTKKQASSVLDALISTVSNVLSEGEQVVIPGFGTYSVGMRSEREGRNPKTGEKLIIKACRVPKFKAGKGLKDAVQNNEAVVA